MLALVNGRVTTVEHSNPEASAVLIQDGKIAELRCAKRRSIAPRSNR
jgi:predicted amidohydrolase YtcJ